METQEPLDSEIDAITDRIIGAAIRVHEQFGPGLLERVYKLCLARALRKDGFEVEVEVSCPVIFEGETIPAAYRLDILVNRCVIVEVKHVEAMLDVHRAQLYTYLKLTGVRVGLILNFNRRLLIEGLDRVNC